MVAKFNPNGGLSDFSTFFPSVTGAEFSVTYNGGQFNNVQFTYNAGPGDPALHYVAVKQGNGFALFYDPNPITSGLINLTPLFPRNPGLSHISFFGNNVAVPEPATWALLILGFGMVGGMLRRKQQRVAPILG